MSTSCTLRDVFQHGLKEFLAQHERHLPYFHAKAALAIRDCRTAALGGHAKWCPHGCVEGVWYNSCRHRACPQCCWTKIDVWLDKVRHRLLPTDHRHITCTLPAELRILWRFNECLIGDLLLKKVRQVLLKLLENPKFLGAKPGLILNLHTWRRDLLIHVHVHVLITDGGWTEDGRWIEPRLKKSLLPTQLIAKELNESLTKALERLLDNGQVILPEDMTRFEAQKLISKAARKKWVVNRKERYKHGEGVAAYLARYIRGGPIKNKRLLKLDKKSDKVTFRVSRRKEPLKTETVSVEDFIGRILLHVPRPGYRVVRSCGLYHHYYAEQLEVCRELLGGGHVPADVEPEEPATADDPDDDSWVMREDHCRICGCLLETKNLPRGPPPPELARYWGRGS